VKLGELGEFGLIERIARAARRSGADSGRSVVLGIGDDAALLRAGAGEDVVVSTDTAVEGVHFRWDRQRPRTVGRRAMVANLSDLAAMGARPLGCVLALSAPPGLQVSVLDAVIGGMLREAATHACPLVGGNLSRARQTTLTLTVLGGVSRGRALRRNKAKPGDRIWVTGRFGASALDVLRARRGEGEVRHVPEPRLHAGRVLSRSSGIGAVIDVSDGLGADLEHLMRDSGCRAEWARDRIPLPRGFRVACARLGVDPLQLAAQGGEDFELLFTARPNGPDATELTRRLGVQVTQIGQVVAGSSSGAGGSAGGWRHF
jgi:thiamine-monophosphate kinase